MKMKSFYVLFLLLPLINCCATTSQEVRNTNSTYKKWLETVDFVVSEVAPEVLPTITEHQGVKFANYVNNHCKPIEKLVYQKLAIALAKKLENHLDKQITIAEFKILENEAVLELMKTEGSSIEDIAKQKIIVLRKKIAAESEEIVINSAINFLNKFAENIKDELNN